MAKLKLSSSVTDTSDKAIAGRVVLTRPAERQQQLAKQLRQSGLDVLELPALKITPLSPPAPVLTPNGSSPPSVPPSRVPSQSAHTGQHPSEKLACLAEVANKQPEPFDALVFVSRAAWHYYHQFYRQGFDDGDGPELARSGQGIGEDLAVQRTEDHNLPDEDTSGEGSQSDGKGMTNKSKSGSQNVDTGLRVCTTQPIFACVGLGTAKQMAADLKLSLTDIIYPTGDLASDSEGLWAILRSKLAPGARVLIVRAQSGRDWLADTLTQHGMCVTILPVYQREPAPWSSEKLHTLKQWAGSPSRPTQPNKNLDRQDHQNGAPSLAPLPPPPQKPTALVGTGNTGVWLITSAQSMAAVAAQYDAHGLTSKPGMQPQAVVVVHERLVPLVKQWLEQWQDHASDVKRDSKTPVVVTRPDDESIYAAIRKVMVSMAETSM